MYLLILVDFQCILYSILPYYHTILFSFYRVCIICYSAAVCINTCVLGIFLDNRWGFFSPRRCCAGIATVFMVSHFLLCLLIIYEVQIFAQFLDMHTFSSLSVGFLCPFLSLEHEMSRNFDSKLID